MYEFLERLVSVALPRIRDFRGLSPNGFDQNGNYSFGLKEHTIFPEIQIDQVSFQFGMDIVLVISAQAQEEAVALLKGFGFPFATKSLERKVL
jgi:large subunit ribosomal protein L5